MLVHAPAIADGLTAYLADIRKFPLLSAEEEHACAVRLFEGKDLAAAQTLITSNLRFVVKIAFEYRHYGMKMLDLIQEGNIGLMMAVRKFNPHKGIRLITYAVWWIKAYIQNHVISSWSLLKIGTTQAQRKLFFKLRQAKAAILGLSDGEEDLQATAATLNVSPEELSEMDVRLLGDSSLDGELAGRDGMTMLEGLADERMNQEDTLAELQENRRLQQHVASAVAGLNEKERYIIEHRVTADKPMTLQDIAAYFAISRERVRQIEEAALRKVRQSLAPLLTAP